MLQDQKRINETLKNIPVKIEGIQAALPDIENINKEQLLTTRNELTLKKMTSKTSSLQLEMVVIFQN